MSKSSVLSMSTLFIFEMQKINGALFLKAIICHNLHYLDL